MHAFLLTAIIITGALGFARRFPPKAATWIVVTLTVIGIFTSPDISMRLTFLGAALAGPLLQYVLLIVWSLTVRPLWYYLRVRTDADRMLFALAPDDPRYEAASSRLDGPVGEATSSGFQSRGRVAATVGPHIVANEFLDRENGREWVIVSATISGTPLPLTLHCSTQLATGDVLVVSNYPYVDPNPPAAGYVTWRLPSLTQIGDLVRAFEAIARRSGPVVAMPLDTDLLTRARERTRHRLDAERQAGFQRYDAGSDVYRPTLKCVYRQFWVSLPPLNWIIDRRDRERERVLLSEIGLSPAVTPGGAAGAPTRKQYREAVMAVGLIALVVLGPELLAAFGGGSNGLTRPDVTVPSGFNVPDSFPSAARALEQLVGRSSHQLMGTKDDEPAPTAGVAISMRKDSAAAFVAKAQDAFLARGFYLFRTGERAASGLETDALALYPTRDPYDLMRVMETNAANYGMGTDDVIAWFRREEARYPIRFDVIGFDYAGGRLLGDVPDATEFASRFIRFCPDIQSAGTVTTRSVARELRRSREIYCWWD